MIRSTSRITSIYDNRVEISLAVEPGLEGPIPRTNELRSREATTKKKDRSDRGDWLADHCCLSFH